VSQEDNNSTPTAPPAEPPVSAQPALPAGTHPPAFGEARPILRQCVAICSTLAVTDRLSSALVMCGGVAWTLCMSNLTVSLIRAHVPRRLRRLVPLTIIGCHVTLVDAACRAFLPQVRENLGIYVGLIVTNCVIMGRIESFALSNAPWRAFRDGLSNALGYCLVVAALGCFREVLAFGTLLDRPLPVLEAWPEPCIIMAAPPGAFVALALAFWLSRFKFKQPPRANRETKR